LDEAKEKIVRKGLVAIAANDVSNPEIGFESNNNELNLVFADGTGESSGRRSKFGCAIWLLKTLHEKTL
jgi:phosphopantothenoylcysteine decarboxylase / phosphopantothenate---cysteine ligase